MGIHYGPEAFQKFQKPPAGFADEEELEAARASVSFFCTKKAAAPAAATTAVVASTGTMPAFRLQLSVGNASGAITLNKSSGA